MITVTKPAMKATASGLCNLSSVAKYLGVQEEWLREKVVSGDLPGLVAGDTMLFDARAITEAIRALATKPKVGRGGTAKSIRVDGVEYGENSIRLLQQQVNECRERGLIDDAGNVRKVLGTLPITADGVVVGDVPDNGAELWHRIGDGPVTKATVTLCLQWNGDGDWDVIENGELDGSGSWYSSRQAALAGPESTQNQHKK